MKLGFNDHGYNEFTVYNELSIIIISYNFLPQMITLVHKSAANINDRSGLKCVCYLSCSRYPNTVRWLERCSFWKCKCVIMKKACLK